MQSSKRNGREPPGAHPRPVHALVDLGFKILNFGVPKVLARCQCAAQQQRSVDRRQFAVAQALAGICVDKVIEEAVLARLEINRRVVRTRSLRSTELRYPRASAMQHRGEAKPGGSDTRERPGVVAVGEGSIFDLPGAGPGFPPEKIEGGSLNFVQKLFVGSRVEARGFQRLPPSARGEPCRRRRKHSCFAQTEKHSSGQLRLRHGCRKFLN
jgi:hypothetical protein